MVCVRLGSSPWLPSLIKVSGNIFLTNGVETPKLCQLETLIGKKPYLPWGLDKHEGAENQQYP